MIKYTMKFDSSGAVLDSDLLSQINSLLVIVSFEMLCIPLPATKTTGIEHQVIDALIQTEFTYHTSPSVMDL